MGQEVGCGEEQAEWVGQEVGCGEEQTVAAEEGWTEVGAEVRTVAGEEGWMEVGAEVRMVVERWAAQREVRGVQLHQCLQLHQCRGRRLTDCRPSRQDGRRGWPCHQTRADHPRRYQST